MITCSTSDVVCYLTGLPCQKYAFRGKRSMVAKYELGYSCVPVGKMFEFPQSQLAAYNVICDVQCNA